MAVDLMMLEELCLNPDLLISIRFYKWKGEWLSIGHNQKSLPKHWINLVKERKLNIVRRPSGGSAVLHSGGLTYSLAWRSPPQKRHQAYLEASRWLIESFLELGLPLQFGNSPQQISSENCFATSSSADLVDPDGNKRIGSAQFWKKGNLLQHGEILLDPPKELWIEIFKTQPPKPASLKIPRLGLENFLKKSFISHWSNLNWIKKDFKNNELINHANSSKIIF